MSEWFSLSVSERKGDYASKIMKGEGGGVYDKRVEGGGGRGGEKRRRFRSVRGVGGRKEDLVKEIELR